MNKLQDHVKAFIDIKKTQLFLIVFMTFTTAFEQIDNRTMEQSNVIDNAFEEAPIRYDGAQLWRIHNISDDIHQSMSLAEILELNFGGIIWKDRSKVLDISFGVEKQKAAHSFLLEHHLEYSVLQTNIQKVIDDALLDGIEATMSEAGKRTKRSRRSGMNWKEYHDLEVIYDFMNDVCSSLSGICKLIKIGKTMQGRNLKVLRISENKNDKNVIWIDGGIHAREWVSPASVTFILHKLTTDWKQNPSYLRSITWYIMPVMNPDGYVFSRRTNRLWRKNRSNNKRKEDCAGVDLNRNFDIAWDAPGSSTNPCSEVYRGQKPASERETQAVTGFLTKRKENLRAYLTFHSYGQVMTYPWAYKASPAKGAKLRQKIGAKVVKRIRKLTQIDYKSDATYELLGVAGGGSDDWSHKALNPTFVYTIELRDTGNYGFLLPPKQIKGTALEAWTAVDTVAEALK